MIFQLQLDGATGQERMGKLEGEREKSIGAAGSRLLILDLVVVVLPRKAERQPVGKSLKKREYFS